MKYRPPSGMSPCKECPFRKTAMPGWLGAASPESFIIEISMERPLPCHPTIDYCDPAWLAKWQAGETGKTCAGSLIMTANMAKLPRDPSFPKLPADDGEVVFATPREFIAHHNNADVRSWESAESRELRAQETGITAGEPPRQRARRTRRTRRGSKTVEGGVHRNARGDSKRSANAARRGSRRVVKP